VGTGITEADAPALKGEERQEVPGHGGRRETGSPALKGGERQIIFIT